MILVGGDGNVAALDIGMESLVATLERSLRSPRRRGENDRKTVNPASKSSCKTTINRPARTSREQ